MTGTSTLSERASIQRSLLLTRLADVNDIVTWADAEIAASNVPVSALIDLAMSRSKSIHDIASLLADLMTDPHDETGIKFAFRVIADRVRSNDLNIETAITSVYNYLRSDNLLYIHDEYLAFCGLQDECIDIRDGVYGNGDLTVLKNPLLDALDEVANR